MSGRAPERGFITIAAVMVLLAVAVAAALTSFMTAWQTSDGQASWNAQSRARHLAAACFETVRATLWENPAYTGSESSEFPSGRCTVYPLIVASGSYEVRTEGDSSNVFSRIITRYELSVDASGSVQTLEQVGYEEVADFE
jgi:hypothetical protein